PKQFHDVVGYYNRFDVFHLTVDRSENRPIRFTDAAGEGRGGELGASPDAGGSRADETPGGGGPAAAGGSPTPARGAVRAAARRGESPRPDPPPGWPRRTRIAGRSRSRSCGPSSRRSRIST